MNRVSTWYKRKAEAVSGVPETREYALKISMWAIFAATDSKLKKKR
ncbi:hypothetical protein EC847_111110 [Scandinavium goeteborgense]|uniref:Uncharacterized protein n=1 Tax=Scandinavium goeteborgense TaxID=1851514 RepID=A0A4R6EE19_SCAGO|nr:hypothetical protein EC847_111110 [Scandinavium goeteborgense]